MAKIINMVGIISSLFITIFCLFSTEENSYYFIYIWPLYMAVIIFIKVSTNSNSIAVNTVLVVAYIKFTLMPFIISLTDNYYNPELTKGGFNNYSKGIFLEIYNFSILLLILILGSKVLAKRVKYNKINLKLYGNTFIYTIIIMIVLILYILFGRGLSLISFFIIRTNSTGLRVDENLTISSMLLRQLMVISVNLLFLISLSKFKIIYDNTNKVKYMIIPLIFAVLNIGLIVGERRSLQLYTVLCCVLMLNLVFHRHKKLTNFIIISSASIVLISMTIYKHFNAFVYGSYSKAIENALSSGSDSSGWGLANTLQAYLYGPQSIATSMYFMDLNNFRINQLIFDILRSFIGPSFLMKDKGILTSQLYNHFIFNSSVNTGHIIPESVYGYGFFGFVFSPILMMMMGFIIVFTEYWFKKTIYLEVKFVTLYIIFRCCVDIFSNLPQTINIASLTLVSYAIILISVKLLLKILPKKVGE